MHPSKTVSMSVRVSHDDAEFIAGLNVNGAKTPSDKLRTIISQARLQHQGGYDYESALAFFEGQVSAVVNLIRKGERDSKKHSELLSAAMTKLPELLAFIVSSNTQKQLFALTELKELESGVADRIFMVLEAVMRLAVTPSSPCYDENVISDRIGSLATLAEIAVASRQAHEETTE